MDTRSVQDNRLRNGDQRERASRGKAAASMTKGLCNDVVLITDLGLPRGCHGWNFIPNKKDSSGQDPPATRITELVLISFFFFFLLLLLPRYSRCYMVLRHSWLHNHSTPLSIFFFYIDIKLIWSMFPRISGSGFTSQRSRDLTSI